MIRPRVAGPDSRDRQGLLGLTLRGLLERSDDFLRLGESAYRFLGEDDFSVRGNFEHTSTAGDQLRFNTQLFLQLGRQTGGPGEIVSLATVHDLDFHGGPPWWARPGSCQHRRATGILRPPRRAVKLLGSASRRSSGRWTGSPRRRSGAPAKRGGASGDTRSHVPGRPRPSSSGKSPTSSAWSRSQPAC